MNIAIVGVATPVGEAILSLIQERKLPCDELFVVDLEDGAGKRVNYGDKYLTVQALEDFDFSDVQLALFVVDDASAEKHVPRAVAAGCRVVDSSRHYRQSPDVPLVVAGVNDHLLPEWREYDIFAIPSAATTQLLRVIEPLHREAGLHRLNVTTCHPVSAAGVAGVEALSLQTARLLNAQPTENTVYKQQIAFNAIPQVGQQMQQGHDSAELDLIAEARKVLADPALMIHNTAITVPVFYGTSQTVSAYFQDPLGIDRASDIVAEAEGVELIVETEGAQSPTAVSDSAGNDSIFVGRLREDLEDPSIIQLWIVADNIRSCVALNCVAIAENLAKNFE